MGTDGRRRALRAEAERLAADGRWSEVIRQLEPLDEEELAAHPQLGLVLARALAYTGRPERALKLARVAEARLRSRGTPWQTVDATNLVGSLLFEVGDLAAAEDRFNAVLERAAEAGLQVWLARASNNLGAVATLRGQLEHALGLFRLAAAAYQKLGDAEALAESYHNIGITYRELDYPSEAEAYYRRAAAQAARAGDRRLQAMSRLGCAELILARGDTMLAAVEIEAAGAQMEAVGDELGRAEALKLRGTLRLREGELEDAESELESAMELVRRAPNPLLEAELHLVRSELYERRGDRRRAVREARSSVELCDELGARLAADRARARLAELS